MWPSALDKYRISENSWTSTVISDTRMEVGHITMDFVTALPRSPKGNNAVWVIIDRLTKLAQFLPFGVDSQQKFWQANILRK